MGGHPRRSPRPPASQPASQPLPRPCPCRRRRRLISLDSNFSAPTRLARHWSASAAGTSNLLASDWPAETQNEAAGLIIIFQGLLDSLSLWRGAPGLEQPAAKPGQLGREGGGRDPVVGVCVRATLSLPLGFLPFLLPHPTTPFLPLNFAPCNLPFTSLLQQFSLPPPRPGLRRHFLVVIFFLSFGKEVIKTVLTPFGDFPTFPEISLSPPPNWRN